MRTLCLFPLASLVALAGCALDGASPSPDGAELASPALSTPAETASAAAAAPSIDRDHRKFSKVVIDDEARARAAAVDGEDAPSPLREAALMAGTSGSVKAYMTPVKDQGGRDTCTSFASAGLIERYTGGDISEQCEVSQSGGEGGQIFYRVKDFLTNGAADERLCTYDGGSFTRHVPTGFTYAQLVARSTFRLTDLDESADYPSNANLASFIKGKIDSGNPVGAGIIVVDGALSGSITYAPATPMCNGVPFSDPSASCAGHAIVITGYNDAAQMFEFRNSWGTGFGNGGYGWLTYDYMKRLQAGPFVTLHPHATRSHEASIEPVYTGVFGRTPQSWEVDAWETNLTSNGWTIPKMRAAFLTNAQTDDGITAVYQAIFGRTPAAWEIAAWRTNLTSNGWTIPAMRTAFRADAQHTAAIVTVYQDVFDRTPAQWEINVWLSNLATDQRTIPTMRVAFADDAQTRTAINNVYVQVLGRAATTAEIDAEQLAIRDSGGSIPKLRSVLRLRNIPIHL